MGHTIFLHTLQQGVRILGETSTTVAEFTIMTRHCCMHGVDPVIFDHQLFDNIEVGALHLAQKIQLIEELDFDRVESIDK